MRLYVAVSIAVVPPTIIVCDSEVGIQREAFRHKQETGMTLYIKPVMLIGDNPDFASDTPEGVRVDDPQYAELLVKLATKEPLPQGDAIFPDPLAGLSPLASDARTFPKKRDPLIVLDSLATTGHTVKVSGRDESRLFFCKCSCGAEWSQSDGRYTELQAIYEAHVAGAKRVSETL